MKTLLARRSGVRDVKDIPSGFELKIPIDILSEQFLPPRDPRRVALEMNRLLEAVERDILDRRAGIDRRFALEKVEPAALSKRED